VSLSNLAFRLFWLGPPLGLQLNRPAPIEKSIGRLARV
jgi:hypothetical protein